MPLSGSMSAAHEWAGIFPALTPLHLTAGAKPDVTTAGLELSQLLIWLCHQPKQDFSPADTE